jgi:hypothetical protein
LLSGARSAVFSAVVTALSDKMIPPVVYRRVQRGKIAFAAS